MTIFHSTLADFHFPLPRLLALPTEDWRGAEIHRRSAENSYINLPGPSFGLIQNFEIGNSKSWVNISVTYISMKSKNHCQLVICSNWRLVIWSKWQIPEKAKNDILIKRAKTRKYPNGSFSSGICQFWPFYLLTEFLEFIQKKKIWIALLLCFYIFYLIGFDRALYRKTLYGCQ